MVFAKNLLNDPDCIIKLTLHTDASDKQLSAFIIQDNKPINLFSKIITKVQINYNTTGK